MDIRNILVGVLVVGSAWLLADHLGHRRGDAEGAERVQSAWDRDKLTRSTEITRLTQDALRRTEILQRNFSENEDALHATLAATDARLATALGELRNRPSRTTRANRPGLPSATAPERSCPAATGADLSQEDAGFLVGEAARADRVVAQLAACQADLGTLTERPAAAK